MSAQFIAVAENWLRQSTSVPAKQSRALAALTPSLLNGLPGIPTAVGIAGPPGTGKSTLAHMLSAVLNAHGTPTAVLSLDDYYLPRTQRQRLASEIHPLLATRGIPGTHDLGLLVEHLDRLLAGAVDGLLLPKFDKSADDRCTDRASWTGPSPRVLFLEGWCVGCPAPASPKAEQGIRELAAGEDADHRWRQFMLQHLGDYARRLNGRLGQRWFLHPPDWQSVLDWRWQQEQQLHCPRLQNPDEVAKFLATFEPLCRYMLETCETWADRTIQLEGNHCPVS